MKNRKHTHGIFCSVFGCSEGDIEMPGSHMPMWSNSPASHGCVCPVGAEKTCAGPLCPRKPIGPAK